MKLCINCYTLNADDAVFCSECGMSLIEAPTGEEALKLGKAYQAAHPQEVRKPQPERPDFHWNQIPWDQIQWDKVPWAIMLLLGNLLFCLIVDLIVSALPRPAEDTGQSAVPSPGVDIRMILIFGTALALVAICIWLAAMDFGARLTDRWVRRGRRRVPPAETRRLGAHMADIDLPGIDLSRTNLEWADFEGANLEGAVLVEADLTGSKMAEVDLEGAVLSRARLLEANLRSANLCRANLAGADLSRANLHRAGLQDANLEGANLRGAILYAADLNRANLRQANLEQCDLKYAKLEGAKLEGASLRGADVDDTTVMPEGWKDIVGSKPADEPDQQGYWQTVPPAGGQ